MKLENILEAILFLSGQGILLSDITEKLQVSDLQIEKALGKLEKKYTDESGIHIIKYNDKIQFASNPEYADNIANVLNPIRERELSQSMLEVLSIVAYKQPLTRLDIEEIRGVGSDYAISNLLKHSLIKVAGRKDSIGKPALFATTEAFLKRFNLPSIESLPDFESLLERIKNIEGEAEQEKDLFEKKEYADM